MKIRPICNSRDDSKNGFQDAMMVGNDCWFWTNHVDFLVLSMKNNTNPMGRDIQGISRFYSLNPLASCSSKTNLNSILETTPTNTSAIKAIHKILTRTD